MPASRPKTARRPRSGVGPTVADVALAAGVSPMTVSRVVNGGDGVRPATRQAVEEAVRALRYQPNPAARSLAGAGRTVRVGLLYANPSAGFLSEVLLGALEEASRAHAQVVVEQCEPGDGGAEAARRLIAGAIDAAVLPPPLGETAAVLAVFRAAGVPTVSIAAAGPPAEGSLAVGIDDRAAALAMTRHLLALGHRRIGFVTGDPALPASAGRLQGWRDGLAEAGIAADPALVAEGLYTYSSGLTAATQLLDQAVPPSAIFASNDDMAAAVVAMAHRRGLDVPGDVSVCGFDDTALATATWPELTTVRQPIAAMARAAIAMAADAARGRTAEGEARRPFDFVLVRRASDAGPRPA